MISTRAGPSAPGELPTRTEFVDIDLDLSLMRPLEPPAAIPTLTDSQVIPLERVSSFLPPTSWTVDRGFSPSMVNALRTTNSEEVVDARQQADFFVSLGQYDQAIQTLRERIDGLGEASPLVYLDLMQLLRRLGRRIDFNQCRDQFNCLFTGRVPEDASFDEKGKAWKFMARCWPISPLNGPRALFWRFLRAAFSADRMTTWASPLISWPLKIC